MIVHALPGAKKGERKERPHPKLSVSRSSRKLAPHHDHFERHAEEAAGLIARGELSVAKTLTRRSAAAYPLPASRGEPLPAAVRLGFEDAFGADLSAVRVHHDGAAAAAARRERAIAFTAGRDIYFAQGEYGPGAADGARVLAHELAHVLQQTAEAGAEGTLRATAAIGSGPIQRVDDEAPFLASSVTPTLTAIVNGHVAANTNPAAVPELVVLQMAALQAADPSGFFGLRESLLKTGAVDPLWSKTHGDLQIQTQSALYDGLKWSGHITGAALLLHTQPAVTTLFLSPKVYAEHIKQFTFEATLGQLYDIWNSDLFFDGARPRDFVDRTVLYMLGPTQELWKQTVSGVDLVEEARDKIVDADHPTTPVQNELFFAALVGVAGFDFERRAFFAGIEKRMPPGAHLARRKRDAAALARQDAEVIHKEWRAKLLPLTNAQRHTTREALYFFARDYVPALLNICDLAQKLWSLAEATENLAQKIYTLDVTGAELVRTLKEDTFFDPLQPAVAAVADEVFARHEDGSLPAPGEYEKKRQSARKRFAQAIAKDVERPLTEVFTRPKPGQKASRTLSFPEDAADRIDLKRFARIAWVLKQSSRILFVLDLYDKNADVAFVARVQQIDPSYPATDYREAHRLRLAKSILATALPPDWGDLSRLCQRILRAQESTATWRQQQHVVAFTGDWKPDDRAPVQKLLTETRPNQIIAGWEPFTIDEIVLFYQAQGYRDFASGINTLVGVEKGRYAAKAEPLLNRAYKESKKSRPVRYKIEKANWEFAIHDDLVTSGGTAAPAALPPVRKTIQSLVRDHPLTTALVAKHKAQFNYDPIGIVPEVQEPDAVIWLAPRPLELMHKLQINPEINILLEQKLRSGVTLTTKGDKGEDQSEEVKGLTIDDLMKLPWDRWWAIASTALDLTLVRHALAATGFDKSLEMERDHAWEQLQDAQREGFNHERRRLVEHQWKPILKQYDRTAKTYQQVRMKSGNVPIGSLPMEMLRLLNRFLFDVQERKASHPTTPQIEDTPEHDEHLAMALVEMSELLEQKFHDPKGTLEIDIDKAIVFHFVPLFYVALDRLDKGGLEPFIVQEERDKPELVAKGKERLERILEYMEDLATRNQKDYGIVGVAGDSTIENSGHITPVDWDRDIDRTTPFTIDGRTWQIVEVFQSFTYHPGAWLRRGQKTPNRKVGSLLKIGDGDYKGESERGSGVLMRISTEEGGQTVDVHEGGTDAEEILTQLTWDATMHARFEHMKELGEAIETLAEYALDLAELFPGVGPAVAATRLLTAVLGFLGGEGKELVQGLINDPKALLEKIKERMLAAVDPERILLYLLFDFRGFNLDAFKKPDQKVGGKIQSSGGGLLKKVLRRLRSIGLGLLNALGHLGLRVRGKREWAQMFVIQRPLLVRIVRFLGDHFRFIVQGFHSIKDTEDSLGAALLDFREHAEELRTRLADTINGMGEIELPQALITVDDIVNVAVDVIGQRLGGKYKMGVKVLFRLLDLIGAKQKVVGAISDLIRDVTGIEDKDVFPLWNKVFLPWIQNQFKKGQDWLHETLAPVLKHVGIDLTPPTTEPKIAGDEFASEVPETMPFGPVRPDARPAALDLSGGSPLPPRVRAQAESRFGHDFGHVRLHTGTPAESVNRPIGAHALTTGSHVLLNGPPPDSLDDSHVLRHELAHVVQQTGPRPLGAASDPSPTAGAPGRGLRIDPGAETVANRVAGQTAREGSAASPVDVGRRPAAGLQPSLIDEIGLRFLRYLVNYQEIEEDAELIDKRAKIGLIAREVRDQIKDLPQELAKAFKSLQVHASVKGTFGSKTKAIGDHLSNQSADIRSVIRVLAIESSDPIPGPKEGTAAKPKMQLNVNKLEAKLSRYIFGKTGVLLEIELRQQKGMKGPHAKLVVSDPVQKLSVRFVHLPPISSNSTLWKDALVSRPVDPLNPGQSTTLTDAERTEIRPYVRQVLRHLGPASNVWDRKSYQLDRAVFHEVEELRTREAELGTKGFLPAHLLPASSEYVKPDNNPVDSVVGQVGLRLGTYDDRKSHGTQWGKGRESHHITQYILAAYFHNGKGSTHEDKANHRAFKLDLKAHPDAYSSALQTKGNLVESFTAPGKPTVEIGATEKGRGGIMPALLLARPTHRYGDLHITPNADDFGDPEQTTQAGALNSTFTDALPPDYRQAEEKGRTDYTAWVQYKSRADVGDAKVAAAIYDGLQVTYATLRRFMQPRLATALKKNERDYFNDIAKDAPASTHPGELTETQVGHVYTAAVKRNDDVLRSKGWVG